MGRGVVLFQKLVGVRPWQVGGDDRPRIFLEIREGIYSHRQISALLRISFFFLANSLNLFGWEVCKGPVSGPHSYQLRANRQCQLQSTIFHRGWPCKKTQASIPTVRNMTPWCYGMCCPTVSTAQSRYRQPLLLQDLVISPLADQDVSLPTALHMAQTRWNVCSQDSKFLLSSINNTDSFLCCRKWLCSIFW